MKLRTALTSVVLVLATGGAGIFGLDWWRGREFVVWTDNAYIQSNTTVISPRIDGAVEAVDASPNQHVKAGEVLVSILSGPFEAAVDAARADLHAAEAQVGTLAASIENKLARRRLQSSIIDQAKARLQAVRAESDRTGWDLDRYSQLLERNSGSRQKYELALTGHQKAEADVRKAEAELTATRDEVPVIDSEILQLESEVERARAMVARAEARVETAEISLSNTLITAPIDGVIGNHRIEPGMYVEAGWPLMSIVPLQSTWVVANLKETQLRRIRIGQEVALVVDAFPDQVLVGRVESLAPASGSVFSLLPPQNASGNFIKIVQRIPMRIAYEVPPALAGRLVPGMSVEVTIDTRSAPDGAALADIAE